jgi:acyl transferase domain-containing protein/acyl carrier protein
MPGVVATHAEPIAIIGRDVRVPGAGDVSKFWENLAAGRESISRFEPEELIASGVPLEDLSLPEYVPAAGVLENPELFDAKFFEMNPREVQLMDPQHRLMLECAWRALEGSGYCTLDSGARVGVYVGAGLNGYQQLLRSTRAVVAQQGELQLILANDEDFIGPRISYKLNLRGPSLAVQTACSTSLVAVHLARQALLLKECDVAVAGGVTVVVPHRVGYKYEEGGILSIDGHCRPFDAAATGTVPGSGVGAVVLKRLNDAIADHDQIHAVLLATAVNNDGDDRLGFTAPSINGQVDVLSQAVATANIEPGTVTYIEAHGTATALGDPVEIEALSRIYGSTAGQHECGVGSVKSNIGHLDVAAGVVGLIKAVECLHHRAIPPSLHFAEPNPLIDFDQAGFFVPTALRKWHATTLLRAAVSSFGFGGTNAHAILETAPDRRSPVKTGRPQLLVLSSKTPTALKTAVGELADALAGDSSTRLDDVAYTLQRGRAHFSYRTTIVASSVGEARTRLTTWEEHRRPIHLTPASAPRFAFLLPGQGVPLGGAVSGLYRRLPAFRHAIDEAQDLLVSRNLDGFLRLAVCEPDVLSGEAEIERTYEVQPILFAIQHALAAALASLGIEPSFILGHSLGEYSAACLAGVFSFRDALAVIVGRAELMQRAGEGRMLAVAMPERELGPLIQGRLDLAAVNAPESCVVSGPPEAICEFEVELRSAGVRCHLLTNQRAFHSAMMEPLVEDLAELIRGIKLRPPTVPYISNVTGQWISEQEATDPNYWARHLRSTVRFADGVSKLQKLTDCVLLDLGPGTTAATLVRMQAADVTTLSLASPKTGLVSEDSLLGCMGEIWSLGTPVNWESLSSCSDAGRIPLPTYPFEREPYWIVSLNEQVTRSGASEVRASHSVEAHRASQPAYFAPSWRQIWPLYGNGATDTKRESWLVIGAETGIGTEIAGQLIREGASVTRVSAGDKLKRLSERSYLTPVGCAEELEQLMMSLNDRPQRIVNCWTATPDHSGPQEALAPSKAFMNAVALTHAVSRAGFDDVDLLFLSAGACKVSAADCSTSSSALLLGLVRVMANEYPNLRCRLLDMPCDYPPSPTEVRQIISFARAPESDWLVALRSGAFWARSYRRVELSSPVQVRENGTYLITGGLGGVGMELAKHLAQQAHVHLIVTGRRNIPPQAEWRNWLSNQSGTDDERAVIRDLMELAQTADITYIPADASRLEEMQNVADVIDRKFGHLSGIVHAAGLPGSGVIELLESARATSVIGSKAGGASNILAIWGDEDDLDFIVLCSSARTISGDAGSADYCAANAFLDFVAEARFPARKGPHVVAIKWDYWLGKGMAQEVVGRDGLQSAEAASAMLRAVSSRIPIVAISRVPIDEIDTSSRWRIAAKSPLELEIQAPPAERHLLKDDRIVELWRDLLGTGQGDSDADFWEAGGNSLMAVQLMSRLRKELGLKLSVREFYVNPTLSHLIALAEQAGWKKRRGSTIGSDR